MLRISYWDNRLYPAPEDRDPVLVFLRRLGDRVRHEMRVLDIGAGAGERNSYEFKKTCKEMIGVDVDPRVVDNPLLDLGVVGNADSLPFEDNSIDMAFAIYVLEHIENPGHFASEVCRVLRPGGEFWAITPNMRHYVSIVSCLTPTQFHKWINGKRGRDEHDTFPTYYRLNSPRAFHQHFGGAGLQEIQITSLEVRPNYLAFALPMFLAGAAYERIVNSTDMLWRFRVNFVCGFAKK